MNCCVYSPQAQTFAKVIDWEENKVTVEIISRYREYSKVFLHSKRHQQYWSFGSFCIALSYLNPDRKYLAYVSPYTRAQSHPFKKYPENCTPEQVLDKKRKLK